MVIGLSMLAFACDGGSGDAADNGDSGTSRLDGGARDGSAGGGGGAGGSGEGGEDGPDVEPDGGSERCKTECAPDDCGEYVSDGCGGHLECPSTCPDGQICGVVRADKCDFPPPSECEPETAEEVCDGVCGAVPDGCSDVIVCSADNGGISCGEHELCKEGACVDGSGSCTPLAAEEACAGKCGLVSDGCSNLIECTADNGGVACGSDEVCSYGTDGATANTCVERPPPSCTPLDPEDACDGVCGIVGDGCGDSLDCDAEGYGCTAPETCGGGGVPGQCGEGGSCERTRPAQACAGRCGFASDGCGSGYQCDPGNGGVSCDAEAGESCGGGGVPGECGAPACEPLGQSAACSGDGESASCGHVPDGCGGLIDCGDCGEGQACGLGGPNLCGAVPTCDSIGEATACAGKCGTVPDGCGGSHACDEGNGGETCSGNEFCGAVTPNECGTPPVSCTPVSCAELGHACGLASDGCGRVINCWPSCDEDDGDCSGSCGDTAACLPDVETGAQTCVEGGPSCTGSLCDDLATSCDPGSPTRLTGTVRTPGRQQNGTWINQLPVPNALVYIPAEPGSSLPDVFEGVDPEDARSCGRCADEELVAEGESILAAAVTDFRGHFTLEGRIPVGTAFRLVVKIGKWRRVVDVPAGISEACEARTLSHEFTRLASSPADGLAGTHLPKIAVSTGWVDEMECVFRNLGIDESEFTVPSEPGRVHMYRSNGTRMRGGTQYACTGWVSGCGNNATEAECDDDWWCSWSQVAADISVSDSELYGSQARLNEYDLVVWGCEAEESRHDAEDEARIAAYVNAGGRMFASHYSYVWIENHPSLSVSSAWGPTTAANDDTGYVSMPGGPTARSGANEVKSGVFRNWLDWQGALNGTSDGSLEEPDTPFFDIEDPRDRAGGSVGPSTDEWVYRDLRVCSNDDDRTCNDDGDCHGNGQCVERSRVQQLSFNTPYGAGEEALCGRVAYSGFHVAATDNRGQSYFPDACSNGELSAQEKVLAFMLFDLATCVSEGDPPQPPSCTPRTDVELCPGANDACGFLSDGCGGVVDCGGCGDGFYCDGTQCRPQECTPATCSSLGFNCGLHPDGCGGVARNDQGEEGCGECTSGQLCGLGGPGLCGSASCVAIPVDVACPADSCGQVSNGCGGTHDCGGCAEGELCGGGGATVCGPGSCAPLAIEDACDGRDCGFVSDGCGGALDCGSCTPPDSCGGGGRANICGAPACDAFSKDEACEGLECGWVSDGCGGAIQCGTCPDNGVCGGAGSNLCGASCSPTTCAAQDAECGAIANPCGGVLDCGDCPNGQTCGAAGPNRCGSGPDCIPRTCEGAGAECGLVGDGCGAALDCGGCSEPGETCGGAGVPNQCDIGTGGCEPITCDDHGAECGAASNGCGGLLDCGGCPQGHACERNACEPLPPIIL